MLFSGKSHTNIFRYEHDCGKTRRTSALRRVHGCAEKPRGVNHCRYRRRGDLYFCASRRGICRLFRPRHAFVSVLHARRRVRPQRKTLFRVVGGQDSHGVRQYAPRRVRAGLRDLFRLDDYGERYGAHNFSAARVVRALVLRQEKVYRFRVYNAERRRKPRRYAHAFRQSAEPVSLLLLFHKRGRVLCRNGPAFCRRVRADSPDLPCRETRTRCA